MINPQDYPEKTPEWTLAKFLELWQERNWDRMLRYCQISWIKIHSEPKKILIAQFRHKLLDAEIIKVEKVADVTRDISLELSIKDFQFRKKIKRKVRLICETGALQPSVKGEWGVNPLSMMRAR